MKVLVTDYDNTLFLKNEKVFINNINILKEFRALNNILIIATGRQYTDIKAKLLKYNIQYDYLICEDGMKIFDGNDKCLRVKYLDNTFVKELLELVVTKNFDYLLDDGIKYSKNLNNCLKIAIMRKYNAEDEILLEDIKTKFSSFSGYISAHFLNIMKSDINKKEALKYLEKLFNLENIYTIGDGINDMEMLSYYGGAVMKKSILAKKTNKLIKYETLYHYVKQIINE